MHIRMAENLVFLHMMAKKMSEKRRKGKRKKRMNILREDSESKTELLCHLKKNGEKKAKKEEESIQILYKASNPNMLASYIKNFRMIKFYLNASY